MTKTVSLTKNMLKMIAVAAMLLDHIGIMLFPEYKVLRIIGRLAFPIFSYSVYEGCKYTRNRKMYLARMAALGIGYCIVYWIWDGSFYGNIFITLSLSAVLVFCLQWAEKKVKRENCTGRELLWAVAGVTGCLMGIAVLCECIVIDYGFWGAALPMFAFLAEILADGMEKAGIFVSRKWLALAGFGIGLFFLSMDRKWIQYFCLFALIPLAFSNGKRGKYNMKYFFYWFYPLHMVALQMLVFLIGGK